ncbi:MAG: restriction endonuclease subunit S [Bacteroidota bacterium]
MNNPVKKRLGDIVNFKRGYDLPTYSRKEGLYPIISSSGITGKHSEYKADGEGLITGRYGTLGEVYYVNGKYWPHNTTLYVTDFKGNYPKYVFFLLKCLGNLKTSDKSTVPGINRNDLHEIKIPYIDPIFQKPLADFLFNVERKIDLGNRINDELEAMAKTIYDYWFVQFDFPDKNGNPYKSSGGKMVCNGDLKRGIPEGWDTGTFSDLGEIIGGSTPPKEVAEHYSNNGQAWITPKDLSLNSANKFISKGEIDVSELGLKAASLKIMPKGTILLSSRAPIGYLAISRENVTTNQGFKSFVPKPGYSTPFIYYTIKNSLPEIINNASGSTFKEISGGTLKSIKVCLPEKQVIQTFTNIVDPILAKQNILELENQQLSSLRDWLLPMLMNGQVKVGE